MPLVLQTLLRTALLCSSLLHIASAYNLLHGKSMECETEGERVLIPPLTADPCIQCKCSYEKTVVCWKKTCPDLRACPVLQLPEGKWDSCCHKCKQCSYAGQAYDNDEQWISTQDACLVHTCKGGVITTARMQCSPNRCPNPVRLPGYCCPVCPQVAGSANSTDVCVRRQCDAGHCQEYRNGCPALDCPPERHWQPTGECCPQCSLPRTEIAQGLRGSCYFQNEYYQHEQSFRPSPCYLCICRDGTVRCRSFVCKPLDCPKQRLYYRPGVCCPFCRNEDPSPCTYLNETHQHATWWDLDVCTRCLCTNGETRCSTQTCPNSYGCPRGYRLTNVKHKCCPKCQEKEAICSVDDKMQIRTFDGYKFDFHASCRYTLSEDCSFGSAKKGFKIIIRNGPDPENRVKHITVRLDKGLRISLLRGKRVKVSGRQVRIPHIRLGAYSIYWDKTNRVTVLRVTKLGLKIIWDGHGSLEVSVSPEYKSRVCGICGNYNGDMSDDLTSQWGDLSREPYTMAQSWKYGSLKKCLSQFDQKYHKKLRKIKKRINEEKKLFNSAFSWSLLNDKPLKIDRPSDPAPPLLRSSHENSVTISSQITDIIPRDETLVTSLKQLFSKATDSEPSPSLLPALPSRKQRHLERLERVCPGGSAKWMSREHQMQKCMILKSKHFSKCRPREPVSPYYWWCMEDACACPSSGHCYCESIEAYASKCTQLQLLNGDHWKRDANCAASSACATPGAVLSSCALPVHCQPTCDSPKAQQCPCVPGCQCPEGSLLHDGRCMPRPLCPSTPSPTGLL